MDFTKSGHQKYLAGEYWQTRRREFLKNRSQCEACWLPRFLSPIFYDQDLHVHHRSYEHIGEEPDCDLQALCRRCHEVLSLGSSNLPEFKPPICVSCERPIRLDVDFCGLCIEIHSGLSPRALGEVDFLGHVVWEKTIQQIVYQFGKAAVLEFVSRLEDKK